MIIKSVTFQAETVDENHLKQKISKDLAGLKETPSCLSVEVWYQKNKTIVSYTLVSKWATKKDFQTWLKRPEHLQQHRDAHQDKSEPIKITRTKMEEYELFA